MSSKIQKALTAGDAPNPLTWEIALQVLQQIFNRPDLTLDDIRQIPLAEGARVSAGFVNNTYTKTYNKP